MDTHAFSEGVKVQRFCLTLVGETRLWHEALRPIALDWMFCNTDYTAIFKDRKQQRTAISCMEIISLQWEFRNIRLLCYTYKAGGSIIR